MLGLVACSGGACPPAGQQAQCRLLPVITDDGSDFVGPEDITIDHERQIAYISADPRASVNRAAEVKAARLPQGAIYDLDLTTLPRAPDLPVTVRNLTVDFSRAHDFHPHGIWLEIDPADGQRTLFVINHARSQRGGKWIHEDVVDTFEIVGNNLTHTKRHNLAPLCRANDIAAVDAGRFLVTNSTEDCSDAGALVDAVLGRDTGSVVLFDDASAVPKALLGNFSFANGISIGPPAGDPGHRQLYVSDSGSGDIRAFDLNDVLSGKGDATGRTVVSSQGAVDNMEWRENGALYVATHPSPIRFALYGRCQLSGSCGDLFSSSPSKVFRIDPQQTAPSAEVTTLYCNDGRELSASSVAAIHKGIILVGSVFELRLLVCSDPPDANAGVSDRW